MHGKDLSLISKALALVFVVAGYAWACLKGGSLPSGEEAFGLIQVGAFIALSFAPVDISMIVKNIKGDK